MIKRLRPKYTEKELKQIYAKPHDHTNWHDHLIRVDVTIQIAKWMTTYGVNSVADLSCGNAAIANSLEIADTYLGDFAPGYYYCGPIETTVNLIPNVDLFICSETLEHVDNPLEVLKAIRKKTKYLVLSTPEAAFDDTNPEHYWAWDSDGIKELLQEAGFEAVVFNSLKINDYTYDYQIWGCR